MACMNVRLWAAILAGSLVVAADTAGSAPRGRAWTPGETYVTPGRTAFFAVRLEATSAGELTAIGTGRGGIPLEGEGLAWRDSSWTEQWKAGFPLTVLTSSFGMNGQIPLVWASLDAFLNGSRYESWLIFSMVNEGVIEPPDTVTSIASGFFEYSTTASRNRRWVSVGDSGNHRLLYSDSAGGWHEVEVPGNADNGTGMAPVCDSTALVAWAGRFEGLHVGALRGSLFEEGLPPPILGSPFFVAYPQFRIRPSGGFWLGWNTQEGHVAIASLRDGRWFDAESLKCAYRSIGKIPDAWVNNQLLEMSRDGNEYPVIVWGGYNYETGAEATCVCVPSDSGFTIAEDLPELTDAIRTGVARDRWGDVWVAWHTLSSGMHFIHTYTKATAGAPGFGGSGVTPIARWSLSEPAPGSWWTVLRAEGGGAFDSVATLRATADTLLVWADSAAPHGVALRYRLRRECLDRRYQWLSPEGNWYPRTPALGLWLRGPHPVSDAIEFAVTGSGSGVLESRLYDLQGRLITAGRTGTSGSGVDQGRVDLAAVSPPVRSGIYFLRVVDGAGHLSNPLRIAVIR